MKRFDTVIANRNLREYAGFALVFVFWTGWAVWTHDYAQASVVLACASFAMGYLLRQHHHMMPLDPAADARTYQAAMLDRIDCQIRLLSTVRYWYLLPLYIPTLWTFAMTWRRSAAAAVVGWMVVTGLYGFLAWLNERVVVRVLRAEREKIAALYEG